MTEGSELVCKAREFAQKALEGIERGNGRPFIEHPDGVARIAGEEIGLPAECLAAVYLHEAVRIDPVLAAGAGDPAYRHAHILLELGR